MVQIIDYHPKWQPDFERLNRAWIEQYFTMEPRDVETLTEPEKNVIEPGGVILFASYNDQIAGTVALKKVDETTFELTKMAVAEGFRRKGIGKAIAVAALEKARELGAQRIILYSETILGGAINLYRQLGFQEIELESDTYRRANIKMEKPLLPMSKAERGRLITSYGKAYEKIRAALAEFPREMWQWRPALGKWTIHENIIHLADSEANSYARCRKFIVEPDSTVMAYDQEAWAENLNYHEQSTEDALELFRLLRTMTYNLIKNLPDEIWEHTIEHPENGTMTFKDWLRVYENHTHIGSMRRVYDAWKKVEGRE